MAYYYIRWPIRAELQQTKMRDRLYKDRRVVHRVTMIDNEWYNQ